MCTIAGRSRKALVVIDVQVAVVATAFQRDQVVANIGQAVERARLAGVPVVWVQHSEDELPIDSEGWQIVPELRPAVGEPIVRKLYRSSFEQTELEAVLGRFDVAELVVCGAESNNCVRHTIHAALERGYDVTLLQDCHTTSAVHWQDFHVPAEAVVDELNLNFYYLQLPGRRARIKPAAWVGASE